MMMLVVTRGKGNQKTTMMVVPTRRKLKGGLFMGRVRRESRPELSAMSTTGRTGRVGPGANGALHLDVSRHSIQPANPKEISQLSPSIIFILEPVALS